jgi:hypothetical protein
MSDLHETCANVGLDSSKLRPIAHATANGRVAVYIGAAWQELPRGKALNLRDQLTRAEAELCERQAARISDPAAYFEAQLQAFRAQSAAPSTTDSEAIALAAIAQEHQS